MPTLVIQPSSADAYIDTSSPTTNFGSNTLMVTQPPASTKRALVKFDLSAIDPSWTINSVTLRLRLGAALIGTSQTMGLYRSLVSWVESEVTWQRKETGVPWSGGNGGAAGSDWNATATDTITASTDNTDHDWDVTADVVAFVDGSLTNHGWWIIPTDATDQKSWRTKEHANTATRPQLIVDYTTPESIIGLSTGAAVATGTLSSNAVTLVSQPDSSTGYDTYIYEFGSSANNNYGVSTSLWVGHNGAHRRSMLRFDLSSIPVNSIILQATLTLNCASEADASQNTDVNVNRGLVEFFQGAKNNAAPDPGQDGSTWNHRNANGSVTWPTGAGGSGAYDTTPTDTQTITATGLYHWDVTQDVEDFVSGAETNYGWWLTALNTVNNGKAFNSSNSASVESRPKLTVIYLSQTLVTTTSGEATATALLSAIGRLRGLAEGVGDSSAELLTNEFMHSDVLGEAEVEGTLSAAGTLVGIAAGTSASSATVSGHFYLAAAGAGTGLAAADIVGQYEMTASAAGTSLASALPDFEGKLRAAIGAGASVVGTMWGKATGVATVIGCNPMPLLYITDGTIKSNGQLNILNFLSERYGFRLRENGWRPQITQYKEGGRFSSGPLSQGRRLRYRNFDNAIETFELTAVGNDQDALIEYQQELMAWQEAAADYWVSDYVVNPVYLVARAARESNIRYAIIHMISVPELENPYAQPFYNTNHAAFGTLTPRIERGHWLSTPPGQFECVPISSVRSWTVSGWETGS